MANNMKAYVYTSDRGVDYKIKLNSEVAEQLDGDDDSLIGAVSAATLNLDPMPRNMRPRGVRLAGSGGKHRTIIVCTPDAPIFGLTPPTIAIEDSDGASTTYSVVGKVYERSRVPSYE